MRPSLSPKQCASIGRAHRHLNIWHGSIRSGKTLASSLAWLGFIENGPRGKLLMAGKTLETLERNVIDPMRELFPSRIAEAAVKHTTGANSATILGRLVHLVGANDAKAEGRIRGVTLAGAYVDEASLVPEPWWVQLLGRLSVPGARLFATTNPDSPNHWLKKDYIDRLAELDLAVWHFTLRDNPGLDPAFLAHIEAEYTGLWRKRYVLGLWVLAEGAIYDTWDPDIHVVDRLPAMRCTWLGVDYGTSNPFVALLLGLGVDGRVYVCAEYRWDSRARMRQKTDEEYSRDVRDWLREQGVTPRWIFVDPSAASWIVQARRDRLGAVTDAENAVEDGIRIVSRGLAQRLRVHRSCAGLINEFPGYVWDPAKQEKGEDAPVKVDDHSLDALRYGVASTEHIWANVPILEAA